MVDERVCIINTRSINIHDEQHQRHRNIANDMYLCAFRNLSKRKIYGDSEWKKIAKHTNHRDKSWSVNPVAYKKCEKILKKSNEIRSRRKQNRWQQKRQRWRRQQQQQQHRFQTRMRRMKMKKKIVAKEKNSAYNMFKYICWYMISLAIRSGGGFVDDNE